MTSYDSIEADLGIASRIEDWSDHFYSRTALTEQLEHFAQLILTNEDPLVRSGKVQILGGLEHPFLRGVNYLYPNTPTIFVNQDRGPIFRLKLALVQHLSQIWETTTPIEYVECFRRILRSTLSGQLVDGYLALDQQYFRDRALYRVTYGPAGLTSAIEFTVNLLGEVRTKRFSRAAEILGVDRGSEVKAPLPLSSAYHQVGDILGEQPQDQFYEDWLTITQACVDMYPSLASINPSWVEVEKLADTGPAIVQDVNGSYQIGNWTFKDSCRSAYFRNALVFQFTDSQAEVVKYLLPRRHKYAPQSEIISSVFRREMSRLRDSVFKSGGTLHPAWGNLIQSGPESGMIQLNLSYDPANSFN